MGKFTAAIIQSCFEQFDTKKKTRKQLASELGVAVQSLGNYFVARRQYNAGQTIAAKLVCVSEFTKWAFTYGDKGEPTFKYEEKTRRHSKKNVEREEPEVIYKYIRQKVFRSEKDFWSGGMMFTAIVEKECTGSGDNAYPTTITLRSDCSGNYFDTLIADHTTPEIKFSICGEWEAERYGDVFKWIGEELNRMQTEVSNNE